MRKYIFLIVLSVCHVVDGRAQDTFQSLFKAGETALSSENFKGAIEFYDKALELGDPDSSMILKVAKAASLSASFLEDDKLVMKYNNIAIDFGASDKLMIDQQLDLAKKYKDTQTTEHVLLLAKNRAGMEEKYAVKLLYFYYNNRKYEEAIKLADDILALRPEDTNVMYLKGSALLMTKSEEEALQLFYDILSKDPDNAKANQQVGIIFYNRASEIYDKENKRYKSLANPSRVDYYNYRQNIQKARPDYEKCIEYLTKCTSQVQSKQMAQAIDLANQRLKQLEQE